MKFGITLSMIILFLGVCEDSFSQAALDTLKAHINFVHGDSLLKKREYPKALKSFSEAVVAFEKNAQWKRQAESLTKIADIHYAMRDFNATILYTNKVLDLCNEKLEKETLIEAEALIYKGKAIKRKGNYTTALKLYSKALAITKSNVGTYHQKTGTIEILMGIAYDDQGFSEQAEKHYKNSLIINEKLYAENQKNQLNTCYLNLAVLYSRQGLYKPSIPYYEKAIALDIEKYGENDPYLAESYYNLGTNYGRTGESYLSLDYFYKALHICKQSLKEGDEYFALIYSGIAARYATLGKGDEALEKYFEALNIYQNIYGQSHIYIAEMLWNIGGTYRTLKKYKEAEAYLKRAEQMVVTLFNKKHRDLFTINTEFGQLYEKQNQYELAKRYYNKKLIVALHNFGPRSQNTSEAYLDIARINLKNKAYKEAVEIYHKAIIAGSSRFENEGFETFPEVDDYFNGNTQLTALYGRARSLKELTTTNKKFNKLLLAYQHFFMCDTLLDHTRVSYQSIDDKMALEENAKNIYKDAIDVALQLYQESKNIQYLKEAFYFSEKNKARLLDEQLRKTKATHFAGIPTNKIKEVEEIKVKLAEYTSKLYEYKSGFDNKDTNTISKYRDLVFLYTQKDDSLTRELGRDYPQYYNLMFDPSVIAVDEIQQKLTPDSAFLEFFMTRATSYCFYITQQEFSVHTFASEGIEEKVIRFREAITQNELNQFGIYGHQLYQELIKPISIKKNIKNLIIAPSGILWHLNFDVLVTEKSNYKNPKKLSYFLQDMAVSYANSAALFFSETRPPKEIQQECLAFSYAGDTIVSSMPPTTFRNGMDDLPGSRKEIDVISGIIDGKYLHGTEAGEANFKKYASQYDILHLAIHGELDDENPENSKLFFTKDSLSNEDNYLYNQEIYNLRIPANLVVLSACNTGSGKIAQGEGVMSMGRAFQYAGAKSLVLTSWEVPDESAPEIMKNFYKNLSKGMNKAEAMQQAKLQFLNATDLYHADPVYWGGFYVLGDISELNFNQKRPGVLYVFGVLILVLIGILLFIKNRKPIQKG